MSLCFSIIIRLALSQPLLPFDYMTHDVSLYVVILTIGVHIIVFMLGDFDHCADESYITHVSSVPHLPYIHPSYSDQSIIYTSSSKQQWVLVIVQIY